MLGTESDLLKGLSRDDSSQILVLGTTVEHEPGHVIFDLGHEARTLYLVKEGTVDLTLPLRLDGRHQDASVEERVPGQMLGWSALVPPHRFTLKATARSDTELLAFPAEDLRELFASRPDLGLAVMTNLAAIVGQRFQLFQTMWVRQVQRAVESRAARSRNA